jgi:hypothetical protein
MPNQVEEVDLQIPFRQGSRQRKRQSLTTQSIAGGGNALGGVASFTLDKVGMLNYLLIRVTATVTLGAAGAFATNGPWSIVRRIRTDLNLSNMNLVDCDGRMIYDLSRSMFRGWAFDGGGNYTPSPLVFSAPVANGANLWNLWYFVPISANPGSDYDTGLINLQAPEVQCNVRVELAGAGADFVTNFTSLTLTNVECHQCYFSSLDPRAVILPLGQVIRTVQFTQAIPAVGENIYTVERQGKILNSIIRVVANGARTDGIDRIQIVSNINDTMYDETAAFNAAEYERDYSLPKPVGIFYKDFWHAREDPSMGDGRDLINLEVLTTYQKKVFVSAGTVLGAGNNFLDVGRRLLVNFASPATTGVNPLSQ